MERPSKSREKPSNYCIKLGRRDLRLRIAGGAVLGGFTAKLDAPLARLGSVEAQPIDLGATSKAALSKGEEPVLPGTSSGSSFNITPALLDALDKSPQVPER